MPQRLPTLGYAVLAQLARQPLTGYELAARMGGAMAYFWAAPHSQIYPQLAALTEAGLVAHQASAGPGPRAKKTYRPTAAGLAALAEWAADPVRPAAVRDELALKAYAVSCGDAEVMAQMFRAEADRHRARLAEYRTHDKSLRERDADLDDPAEPLFGNWSALRLGLLSEQAQIDWCEWMVARLLAAPVTAAAAAPTSRAARRSRAGRTPNVPSGSG